MKDMLVPGTIVSVRVYNHPNAHRDDCDFTHRVWTGFDIEPDGTFGLYACILGYDKDFYLVEVPTYIESFLVEEDVAETTRRISGVPTSYTVGKRAAWVRHAAVTVSATVKVEPKGMKCAGACGEHNLWAEANMPDKTFVCYSCRQDPYRASPPNAWESDI